MIKKAKLANFLYKIIDNSYLYYSQQFDMLDKTAKGKPEEFFITANTALLKEQGQTIRGLNAICYAVVDGDKETYTRAEFLKLADRLKAELKDDVSVSALDYAVNKALSTLDKERIGSIVEQV